MIICTTFVFSTVVLFLMLPFKCWGVMLLIIFVILRMLLRWRILWMIQVFFFFLFNIDQLAGCRFIITTFLRFYSNITIFLIESDLATSYLVRWHFIRTVRFMSSGWLSLFTTLVNDLMFLTSIYNILWLTVSVRCRVFRIGATSITWVANASVVT